MHMFFFNYSKVGVYRELEEQAEQTRGEKQWVVTIFIPVRHSAFVHSSSPWRPWAPPREGGRPGVGLQSPSHRDYTTAPTKKEKEEKVNDNKMYEDGKVRGLGCGGIQLSAATWSARVHVHRAARPKTTHALKMQSRDQSSDGQVGESKWHLMDSGSVEWKRSSAAVWPALSSSPTDDAQHKDRHFYDGCVERQTWQQRRHQAALGCCVSARIALNHSGMASVLLEGPFWSSCCVLVLYTITRWQMSLPADQTPKVCSLVFSSCL